MEYKHKAMVDFAECDDYGRTLYCRHCDLAQRRACEDKVNKEAVNREARIKERSEMERCEVCGKKHQRRIKVKIEHEGQDIEVDEIHSPCLDELSRLACGVVNKVVKGWKPK